MKIPPIAQHDRIATRGHAAILRRRAALILALAAVSAAAHAELSCPDSLPVEQRATPPSADWQIGYAERPLRLIGVTVYDGLPSQHKVRPASQRSAHGALAIRWKLPENLRSYYVVCNYEQTTARLYRALPPGVLMCEAVFDLRVEAIGGHPVKRMYCR